MKKFVGFIERDNSEETPFRERQSWGREKNEDKRNQSILIV